MKDTSDLKIWYKEDIAHILLGVGYVMSAASDEQYKAGASAALTAIALACGIEEISNARRNNLHNSKSTHGE